MRKIVFWGRKLHALMPCQLLLTMKLATLLFFLTCMQLYAKSYAQEKISLQLKETSILQLLKAVEKQSSYRFVYHNETLPAGKITITANDEPLETLLDKAFAATNLHYAIKEDGLVVIYARQEDHEIRGKVNGADNLPLPGVTVRAGNKGALTDINGQYIIQVPEGAATLEFSLIGYSKQQVSISDRKIINVTLQIDVQTLNSVTITGYTNYTRDKSASATAVVGADKISQVPMATFDQVLQGRVPGLVVSSGSGQPGTNASVVLRGVGTVNGNSSLLYVVDGVPVESNYLQAINPSDIESITVLKDASSKALYGSRGANGVLVITTKKGKSGKLTVEYKSQYGISQMTSSRTPMMNTKERLQFEEEIGETYGETLGAGWAYSKKNPGYAALSSAEQLIYNTRLDSISHINTNWRDILLRTGKFMEQQISASGGNENVRFYTSINYYKQDGIVLRSGLERYTLKNNLDFTAGKLTANVNLGLGYANSSFIEREGSSKINNPIASTMYALPYEYPYAADGTMILPDNASQYNAFGDQEGATALEGMQNRTRTSNQVKGILSSSLNYAIGAGFVAKTRLGIDFRETTDQRYINPDSYSGSNVDNGSKGSFGEGLDRTIGLISTSGITWGKKIAAHHDIEVSAFYEYSQTSNKFFNYEGYGLNGKIGESPAAITPGSSQNAYSATLGGGREKRALVSYIGVGRYTFDGKYTLNASYRYDGSSTVPPTNRWHGFYSAGLGWEAKKEPFLSDISFINDLRFRVSYGTTASPFASAFGYAATFDNDASYNGNSGIAPSTPGYAKYDWEYAKEFNAGFDLAIWNNRVRIVTDVYNKVTSNLFLEQRLSLTSGFKTLLLNSGAMRNRGIETDIQADVLKVGSFTWSLGFNIAYNKNVITNLGGAGQFEQNTTEIVMVGHPYGSHYAPKWAGVNPANGDPQYYTRDGKITTDYNFSNLSIAEFGTYIPAITGGFNTGFRWKGFYLAALFTYADKTNRYNNEDYYNENPSFTTSNQTTRMLYNRWKKPGDNAILPRYDAERHFTSRDIQDASYIRLRNVNLGYDVPFKMKYIRGIHIFVQAQNLHTWTKWRGFDPEDNDGNAEFDYPSARTYTAGLNVNF